MIFERKYTRKMRDALMKQLNPILRQIERDFTSVDYNKMKPEPLIEPMIDLYVETGSWFAGNTIEGFKGYTEAMFYKQSDEARAFERIMMTTAENLMLRLGLEITDTSRSDVKRMLQKIINEATQLGYGVDKTAKIIKDRLTTDYKRMARWKGKRIARTEIGRAANMGTVEGAIATGKPLVKSWITGGTNIRDSHIEAEGNPANQNIPINQDFIVGGHATPYPMAASLPPEESINCKCAVDIIELR